MESIDLIRENLRMSEALVLRRIEDMRDLCMVSPTPRGGCHTLWVIGHLAYIESLIIRRFMLGEVNPLADWANLFDGADVSNDPRQFPEFDAVLEKCRSVRASTRALLDSYVERDLDPGSVTAPEGYGDILGTRRHCFQYAADHWFMHRGQLADARRAAGLKRMWV